MKEVNSSEVTSVEIAMGTLEGPLWVGTSGAEAWL